MLLNSVVPVVVAAQEQELLILPLPLLPLLLLLPLLHVRMRMILGTRIDARNGRKMVIAPLENMLLGWPSTVLKHVNVDVHAKKIIIFLLDFLKQM